MAKGNLFLGTAAKSVGDVVMYRREGSQVSRVRVRKIANPKTDAQCEQRAFMSAVVKFYQSLANVLDRSWQGLSRSKSYSKFLKTNASIVRAGGYYLPKGTGFFPLPLKLSNGTVIPVSYEWDDDLEGLKLMPNVTAGTTITTIGSLSEIFVNNGYQNGDVVTMIVVTKNDNNQYAPVADQFVIDTTSTVSVATAFKNVGISVGGSGTEFAYIQSRFGITVGGAVIVARNNDGDWLRSTQNLVVVASTLSTTTSDEAKAAAIASYKGSAASDNPLVYLDGDELENS